MNTRILLCAVLALVQLNILAAENPADAKALEGTWKPTKAELSGKPMPDEVLKTISLKMDHGKYEVFVGDKPDKGTYSIDSAAKPHGITVVGTEGPNQGKTYPAIYELTGDTLRICYDLSGAKRPTEFKSVPGTKLYLVTYVRNKT